MTAIYVLRPPLELNVLDNMCEAKLLLYIFYYEDKIR